ncbi:3-oxoacyl-ACP reductase family protein [Mycobacterium sp. NAZ190054]|uniref:3-oxoacyl-ACP reductase family protein n=1 Tax=Mycobacterium sp. NAZ190054 TaxID=1747766 RepID=UPI00079B90B3|nr:3-oxoacyl-ACP reductase family protein [Mycobacterium sp. NAZ190054]KWX69252.1 3-oxoacyl-ACP reductase [Mycobacterium sp. NAZ190054]
MSEVEFDFSKRVVITTGAAQGIGCAIADRFARAGATVVIADVDDVVGPETAAAVGASYIRTNVADSESVQALVERTVADHGRVDVVVNNAGILRDGVLWKLSDHDWDAVLAVHLGGTFRLTRACVPHFRAQQYGRVINVTSYTGLHGNLGQSAYAAAKAGIIGFTKTAAKELARFGVTVNAISPNAETRMIAGIPDEKRAEFEAMTPIGRYGTPEEMSEAVAFLASEQANYITGVVLPIDGGLAI